MPRHKKPTPEQMASWQNPLGEWMAKKNMRDTDGARLLGVAAKTLHNWMHGGNLPELPFLYEIQRCTDNAVCIEDWLTHPHAVEIITNMRAARQALKEKNR